MPGGGEESNLPVLHSDVLRIIHEDLNVEEKKRLARASSRFPSRCKTENTIPDEDCASWVIKTENDDENNEKDCYVCDASHDDVAFVSDIRTMVNNITVLLQDAKDRNDNIDLDAYKQVMKLLNEKMKNYIERPTTLPQRLLDDLKTQNTVLCARTCITLHQGNNTQTDEEEEKEKEKDYTHAENYKHSVKNSAWIHSAHDPQYSKLHFNNLEVWDHEHLFMVRATSKGELPESCRNVVINPNITTIAARAFYNCTNLKSIAIPSSVTTIEEEAFSGCSKALFWIPTPLNQNSDVTPLNQNSDVARYFKIPTSVTTIHKKAFAWCHGLNSVTVPTSVTTIHKKAFMWCHGLKSVTILNSIRTIQKGTFQKCIELESVTIPHSVTSIETESFLGCEKLTSIDIPSSVTTIGLNAFPESTTVIFTGYECKLYEASLASITIPNGVTKIGEGAFQKCRYLSSITIPPSVKEIGEAAFFQCYGLKSIKIPESVTTIGNRAFQECIHLEQITLPNTLENIGSNVFDGCEKLPKVKTGLNNDGTLGSVAKGIMNTLLEYLKNKKR